MKMPSVVQGVDSENPVRLAFYLVSLEGLWALCQEVLTAHVPKIREERGAVS